MTHPSIITVYLYASGSQSNRSTNHMSVICLPTSWDAQLLNIEDSLGPYENELQTEKTPYSWTLNFKSVVTDSYAFDKRMESYASLLMFSIDNLEKVNWTYQEKFPNTIRTHKASITRAECAKFVGELRPEIKSPYFCQELIYYLNKAKYPSN